MNNQTKIYLSTNHILDSADNKHCHAFLFNEKNKNITTKWMERNIEQNNGCFVVMDHKNAIYDAVKDNLTQRNYYVECGDVSKLDVSINPFSLIKNVEDAHSLFLEILYVMWDNKDEDIPAMSCLIDAFVSCMMSMFADTPEKLTMEMLQKMVSSVNATCEVDGEQTLVCDALFANLQDQNSMPCKYYAIFKKAAGECWLDVAKKVAQLFNKLSEREIAMMSNTDESVIDSFEFKTAMFLNVEDEDSERTAKLLMILLNRLLQTNQIDNSVLMVVDRLDSNHKFINISNWLSTTKDTNVNYLIAADNIAVFMQSDELENYFRQLQAKMTASVLIHHSEAEDVGIKDSVATVLISDLGISTQDTVFA